ncbi:hypothetical protein TSAR_002465 [Trichomalopsis sarcophagae]|uniref:RBR-type E3 ubiquitin transferase n=1 Tax=Trichomalopsis sarcophagae TaxID=543379 RepID=A0A232FIQ0_9HYME|nr:hypothetical protein TSAR_002465 [Trichomalopsis sarcophagae]
MDYEDDLCYDDIDSGNESSGDEHESTVNPQEKAMGVDEYQFEVLSTEQIVQYMVDTIKEVNTVVEIPATTTRILLNHFNWDKEKLMERFYDGDQEKLFEEARVVNPFRKGSAINRSVLKHNGENETEECGVCYLTLPSHMMNGLECGHRFCTDCWREYLHTKIMKEGVGQTIACAAHDCDILVDDASVMRLVEDSAVKLRYQHLITNNFVECNKLLKWCRSPNCNNAIKVLYVDTKPVTCKCNYTFCFNCGENWHDPVQCDILRKWIKKCNDDSETSNWIVANTKECIKCKAIIEKNGGCNHMICKNKFCRAEFCWICLEPWKSHGATSYCNRFDIDVENVTETTRDKSHKALQKYLFYSNRYANHLQSLQLENNLYKSVKAKMQEMQERNMSWIEVQFLKTAVDVLCACRQTLMYSYVFAFYVKKNNQTAIFEDNQQDLENATEILSRYLERDMASEDLVDIKQKVQDKYKYCNGRRKVLLEHVQEGRDKDWWEIVH